MKHTYFFTTLVLISILGLTIFQQAVNQKAQITKWEHQYEETRDAWLRDRQDWANGKSFEYHYGQHGQRW